MRLAAALAVAAAALVPLPAAGDGAPSREELRQKSSKELRAMLRRKGAKCKKCVEKDDIVDRVIETWDWVPKEAASPDGKIRMTKDMFIKHLKETYTKHMNEHLGQQQDGHHLDLDDGDGGEGEKAVPGMQLPDLEKVWADFSEKLQLGEVQTDENGRLIYEVGSPLGTGSPVWWEKYKIHLMILLNLLLLLFVQRRRKERVLARHKEDPRGKKTEISAETSEGKNDDAVRGGRRPVADEPKDKNA